MPLETHQLGELYVPQAAGQLTQGSSIHCWTLNIGDVGTVNVDFTTPNFAVEIVEVVLKKGAAGGAADTHTVQNGANAITNAMDTNVGAGLVVRPTTLVPAQREIAAGGTLRVAVNDGGAGATDCEIDVYWIRT